MVNRSSENKEPLSLYELYLESIQDGALVIEKDGYISDFNQNFLQLSGFEPDDFLLKDLAALFPLINKEIHRRLQNSEELNRQTFFETEMILKDQSVLPVEICCQKTEASGQLLIAFRDITGYMKMTTWSKKDRAGERFMLKKSPESVVIFDTLGRVSEAGRSFLTLCGVTYEEIIGKRYDEIFSDHEKSSRSQKPFFKISYSNRLKTKNGKEARVQCKSAAGVDLNGLSYTMVFTYTIEEYRQLITCIKKERKFMKKILSKIKDQSDTGVLIFRVGHTIVYANEFINDKLGYSEKELLHVDAVQKIYHPDDYNRFTESQAKLLENQKSTTDQFRFIGKTKDVYEADVTLSLEIDDNGSELILFQLENIKKTGEKLNDFDMPGVDEILSHLSISPQTGVSIVDAGSGNYIYTNDLLLERLGYSEQEMQKIKPTELIYAEDFPMMRKNGVKVYLGLKKEVKYTARYVCKNRNLLEASFTVGKIKDKSSKKVFFFMLLDDIKDLEPAAS